MCAFLVDTQKIYQIRKILKYITIIAKYSSNGHI